MKKMKLPLLFVTLVLLSISGYRQKDTTKAEFKPSGKLWGYAFGDLMYKAHTNSFGMNNVQY